MTRRSGYRRDGFTLIELLVVIAIIAILISLTAAGVMKVKDAGTRTENGWRMGQITTQADKFCSDASIGQPGYLPPAPFALKNTYNVNDPEAIYLKRLFPNLDLTKTGLTDSVLADGNQVAVFFLTGGAPLDYQGFARGQQPFVKKMLPDEVRVGPHLQLKASMYSTNPPGVKANGHAWLVDPYGTPYAIFMAGPKGGYFNASGGAQTFSYNVTVSPYSRGSSPVKYENPKSIQIISAGPDKLFGVGGDWSAGAQGTGRDDTSNFSTATLASGPQ